jgi:hypothetical protein
MNEATVAMGLLYSHVGGILRGRCSTELTKRDKNLDDQLCQHCVAFVPCTSCAYFDQQPIAPSPSSYTWLTCRDTQKLASQAQKVRQLKTRIEVDIFLTSYKQHTPQRRNTMSRVLYWSNKNPRRTIRRPMYKQIPTSPCNGYLSKEIRRRKAR